MSGNEVVARAREAYEVGLFDLGELERWVERGQKYGEREVPHAILALPFPWQIERALEARAD